MEPRTRRGRQRRRTIVSAAAELMYVRGARATAVDDVLESAGVGKGQFYHYFSSKQDLVTTVLEHQLELVLEDLRRFQPDTWSGIRGWFQSLLEGQERRGLRGCPVGSLVIELAAEGDEAQGSTSAAFARWEAVLAEGLTSMRREGKLVSSARPDRLAAMTLAAIQGGYVLSTAHRDLEPMRNALGGAYAHLRSFRGAD